MNKVTMVAIGVINQVEGKDRGVALKTAKVMIDQFGYPEALRRAKMINAGELPLTAATRWSIHALTTKAQKNAEKIIESFKSCPKDHEFYMLKGVLIAGNYSDIEVDGSMIAARMDELNKM